MKKRKEVGNIGNHLHITQSLRTKEEQKIKAPCIRIVESSSVYKMLSSFKLDKNLTIEMRIQ
jgi:hypothetical protein